MAPKKHVQVTLDRVTVEKVVVKLPPFCPHCGQDFSKATPDGAAHPLRGSHMAPLKATARYHEALLAAGAAPPRLLLGDPDRADSLALTTGYDCAACGSNIVTANGEFAPARRLDRASEAQS